MKEHDRKWITAGDVRHEAVLTGEIKSIEEEKERFYYHRYIYVQTIQLQTATKLITAKKITPLTKNLIKETFTIGDVIRLYGSWENNKFVFNQYTIEKKVTR
jgi:DNA helicase TIP49 (TBP-interacting protein)